jgi:riboflavin kinase
MADKDISFLLALAQKADLHGTLASSTVQLAEELGVSQQTVSRKLQDLFDAGTIDKSITPNGVTITLTEKGKAQLRALYGELQQLFGKQLVLHGIVKDGFGEGKFYMSQEGYIKQFAGLLGFTPYHGTLNLAVDKYAAALFLSTKKQSYISGFQTKERTFGGLKCYPILIAKKTAGAVVVPDRTAHTLDTIELIAPIYLRDQLKLENGKEVVLS